MAGQLIYLIYIFSTYLTLYSLKVHHVHHYVDILYILNVRTLKNKELLFFSIFIHWIYTADIIENKHQEISNQHN